MKKFSKLIALVLVLSLVFAFTACGKGGSDDTIKLGILCSLTGNSQTNGGYAPPGCWRHQRQADRARHRG